MADRGRTTGGKQRKRRHPAPHPVRRIPSAPRRKKIDSVDIARLVGVARSTVSKTLNGYPYIAAGTRERILKAVRALGITPTATAQVLAGKRTTTLGLFFYRAGNFADDVLADFMISSVIENAAALGYQTLAYIVRGPKDDATGSSLIGGLLPAQGRSRHLHRSPKPRAAHRPARGGRPCGRRVRPARQTGPSRTGRW